MKKITLISFVMFGFLASGCVNNLEHDLTARQANYNNGETVILSLIGKGACLNCYNHYRGLEHEKAFAISESGKFGFASSQQSQSNAQSAALKQCRARNAGNESAKPCKLLMTGDRYVWK